ncbi:MAG TPA: response regulator transcription factor [Pirellulales bacterium]|jgi:DNA-binding NarL/FixJ family response regulator
MQSNQADGASHLPIENYGWDESRPTSKEGVLPSRSQVTVVVVDKEQLVADLMASVIRSFGMNVVGAFSSLDPFLNAVSQRPPSLAIIDARLPDVQQAIGKVRSLTPRVAFVVMDDVFRDYGLNRALSCGAEGYLTKQDPLEKLEAALDVISTNVGSSRLLTANHRGKRCTRNPAFLSEREIEVLRLLATGLTLPCCAFALGISANALENHKAHIVRKINARRTEAA